MPNTEPILDIRHLVVEYRNGRCRRIQAVADISFQMTRGETLGLVGESGCGKTSVARAIIQLPRPRSGNIFFQGEDITRASRQRLRRLRPRFQMIFQDSIAALNPGRTIGATIAMPLKINRRAASTAGLSKVRQMMASTGLDPQAFPRRPFQLSGGQCQRVQIARALMTDPQLLICDEPVSSRDVSIQAQIINRWETMRRRHGLTMLIISHDMAVVKNMCDRVAVMYLGKLCEIADSENLYRAPRHPYTAALLASIPELNRKPRSSMVSLQGVEMPSPALPPSGCRYRTRCQRVHQRCSVDEPTLERVDTGGLVACHYPLNTE